MTNNEPHDSRQFDGMWVDRTIDELDPLAAIPTDVLDRQVRRHGRCLNEATTGEPPDPHTDEPHPDRWLAERLCHGCPVQRACLETELRKNGEHTTGVWGGLTDDDRRALLAQWEARPERAAYVRENNYEETAPPPIDVISVETTELSVEQRYEAVRTLATLIESWVSGSDHSRRATVGVVDGGGAA